MNVQHEDTKANTQQNQYLTQQAFRGKGQFQHDG
jgi:hypothetical protein